MYFYGLMVGCGTTKTWKHKFAANKKNHKLAEAANLWFISHKTLLGESFKKRPYNNTYINVIYSELIELRLTILKF